MKINIYNSNIQTLINRKKDQRLLYDIIFQNLLFRNYFWGNPSKNTALGNRGHYLLFIYTNDIYRQ